MSDTFKLVVPAKVEEKIRYLIRKFPKTEWSGVLFYSYTGSFAAKDLVITCQDIYPMDLGTSGWTVFKMNEDVTAYMAENLELFDYEIGLIHSHHVMGAFLSGQDNAMLQQEGNDTNCFVSLVVDTKGEYVAAVTRKLQTKTEVITKSLGTSYEFFGEGEVKTGEDPMSESTRIIDKEIIQYFMLDVEREEVVNPLSWLDDRFNEIEQKKEAQRQQKIKEYSKTCPITESDKEDDEDFNAWLHKKTEKEDDRQLLLFDKETMKEMEVTPEYTPDAELVHNSIVKMILCSLIVKSENIDLRQWISKYMTEAYQNIFTDYNGKAYGTFESWVDFVTEFLVLNFNDPDAPAELVCMEDEYFSAIAQAMCDELHEYSAFNNYIPAYISALERYII